MEIPAVVCKIQGELEVKPERIKVPRGQHQIVWEIDQTSLPGWTFDQQVAFAPNRLDPFSNLSVAGATLEVTDTNDKPEIIVYKLFLRDENGNRELLDPEIENEDDPVFGG